MLINHITEADYQKLLKVKENAGKVKEKVGYNKNPIKLPGNFLEGIDNARRYSNTLASTMEGIMNYPSSLPPQIPFEPTKPKPEPERKSNVKKTFVALILLVAVVLLFYSIKQKKTA